MPRGKQKPKDEFVDWSVHLIRFVRDNFKMVVWCVGIAALAFLVIVAGNRYHTYRVNKADNSLFATQRFAAGTEERISALREIALDYSSTPAGREALMMIGDELMNRGDFAGALAYFDDLAKNGGKAELLKIAAIHKAALALKKMGKTEEAAERYLSAANDPKNLNQQESLYEAARCFEDIKKYDEAARLYKKVIDQAQEGSVKSKGEDRLLWLISNGFISG